MAQVWDGTANDILNTTTASDVSVNTGVGFSACGWANTTNASFIKTIFTLTRNNAGNITHYSLSRNNSVSALTVYGYATSAIFPDTAIPTNGTWFFWATTTSGLAVGSARLYVWTQAGGWVVNSNTLAVQAVAGGTEMSLGNCASDGQEQFEMWVGSTQNLKVWQATLTQQEIESERLSLLPVRMADLRVAIPGVGSSAAAAFRDLTGRPWSLVGTITYNDAHPGVTYGSGPTLVPSVTYLPSGSPDEAFQSDFVQANGFQVNAYVFIRPNADVTTGWSTSSGTSHFALIDEEVAEDTDYIFATSVSQTDEVRLPAMSSPQGDILVNYRVQGIVGAGKVTVSMYAGAALVKADTQRDVDGNYTMTVTSTDYAAVSDWSDIRLRFVSG